MVEHARTQNADGVGGSGRWALRVGLACIALVVGLWWWWPSLTRDFDRIDVVVVGVDEVVRSNEPIERRIREEGMSVETIALEPCRDLERTLSAVRELRPSVVVVSPSETACDDWSSTVDALEDAAGGGTVIVLAQTTAPGLAATAAGSGAVVSDPLRLLGDSTVVRMPCLWWDDCDPDGTVAVRGEDGRLTEAGAQRVARVLVGSIP